MAERGDLRIWVVEALRQLGGEGTIVQVSQRIWQLHENDLRASGDLFYTWQYDVRWAAQYLRDTDLLVAVGGSRTKLWTLSDTGKSIAVDLIKTHGRM
ncbi:hypothetical protein [uncultured Microbacterium sp.]|uniref:hypothetical protein n=1 Tax=uncultured Microbacterium sp. TaxID=191216 RepID=UPI002627E8B6|nr:hypothetical protein [uncultured Microbacterium sp.]